MIYLGKSDSTATRMYCFPNGIKLITIIQVGKAHNKIWPPETRLHLWFDHSVSVGNYPLRCLSINSSVAT